MLLVWPALLVSLGNVAIEMPRAMLASLTWAGGASVWPGLHNAWGDASQCGLGCTMPRENTSQCDLGIRAAQVVCTPGYSCMSQAWVHAQSLIPGPHVTQVAHVD